MVTVSPSPAVKTIALCPRSRRPRCRFHPIVVIPPFSVRRNGANRRMFIAFPSAACAPRDQEARSIASATLGSAGLTKWHAEVEVANLIVSGFPVQTRRSQSFLREGGARRIVQIHRRRILHPRLRTAFQRMSIFYT